ncbi:hypothetical protein CPB84DRAFT_1748942 [Gymnopilus junonius]|uniref:Uncharacterized protein n=1 Tax=Gymnopilus junonius TaxID=109634 RepID=A0A9P5TL65_GYMJU|nr:hypothetical protein CPB84DRAFT_1748942 [Gymnopilus junonius]
MKAFMQELKSSEGWQGVNHFTEEEDWEVKAKMSRVFGTDVQTHWQEGDHFLSVLNFPIPNVIRVANLAIPLSGSDLPTNFHFSMEEGAIQPGLGLLFHSLPSPPAISMSGRCLYINSTGRKKALASLASTKNNFGICLLAKDARYEASGLVPPSRDAARGDNFLSDGRPHEFVLCLVDGFKTSKLAVSVLLECLGGDEMVASEGSVQEAFDNIQQCNFIGEVPVCQSGRQEALRALNDLHMSNLACWECLAEKMKDMSLLGKEIIIG